MDTRRLIFAKGWGAYCSCKRCENELNKLNREKVENDKIMTTIEQDYLLKEFN